MEWISVETKLPDPNKEVLIFNRYRFIGCIEEDGQWFASVDFETLHNVTHWMPLPAAPATNNEKG